VKIAKTSVVSLAVLGFRTTLINASTPTVRVRVRVRVSVQSCPGSGLGPLLSYINSFQSANIFGWDLSLCAVFVKEM